MMTDGPAGWPALPLDEWAPTRDTLQLWTQIVGKILLRSPSPAASRWRAELRSARAARGLLARGQQRRLLARSRRRRHLLLLRLSRTGRLPDLSRGPRRGPLRCTAGRVPLAVRGGSP